MEKNLGPSDRFIRVLLAVIIFTLYMTETISGTTGIILLAVAVVLLLTTVFTFCPLYFAFGLSTLRKKKHV